jgi:hypothetical protein
MRTDAEAELPAIMPLEELLVKLHVAVDANGKKLSDSQALVTLLSVGHHVE